ncbi:MAG: hypothetical protein CMJ83_22430 [Planctomycetes bacterium]|nr:hypothetical protein [Planctomycetota bacterium]
MPRLVAILLILGSAVFAQSCPPYTMTCGWDESGPAQLLGGGVGPEDIAWNPVSQRLYVAHDRLNSSVDILLEYDVEGMLIQANVGTPGSGGLCAMPGSGNLLMASGSVITEIDASGAAVPGGVILSIPGYGNIQDLDFDAAGALWIHNGNTGDLSTVDLVAGTATSQFTLAFGSQCLTFLPSGNLALAAAFFNPGLFASGEYVEVDPATGNVVCNGFLGSALLPINRDPCVTSGMLTTVNGFTWIEARNELGVSSYFTAGGVSDPVNIIRYAPDGTARIGTFGTPGVRSDMLPFNLRVSGDPVIGGSGITFVLDNVFSGDTLLWGVGFTRDCNNPTAGTNGSTLYLDIAPVNVAFSLLIPAVGTQLVIPIDFSTFGPALAGVELFSQFAGTDLGAPTLDLLLSQGAWMRFDLQ